MILGGSILSTFITNTTTQHKTGISQQLTTGNESAALEYRNTKNYYISKGLKPQAADKLADNPLNSEISRSATLLTYKEIYLVMAVISFLPIILILFTGLGRRSLQSIEVEPIPL